MVTNNSNKRAIYINYSVYNVGLLKACSRWLRVVNFWFSNANFKTKHVWTQQNAFVTILFLLFFPIMHCHLLPSLLLPVWALF